MSTVNGFQVGNDVLKYNYESLENYNTPDFSPSSTYSVGDYVIYQGKLYKCITAITTAGAWNSANWQLAVLSNDVKIVKGDIASNYDPSSTYAVGDYVLYNDQLYVCNTEISTAEAWTSAHWTLATMGDDVSNLKNQISAVKDLLDDCTTVIDATWEDD